MAFSPPSPSATSLREHWDGVDGAVHELREYFRSVAQASPQMGPSLAEALTQVAQRDAVMLERACFAWNSALSAPGEAAELASGAEALRRHLDSLVVTLTVDGAAAVAAKCRADGPAKIEHCAAVSDMVGRMAAAAGVSQNGAAAETDEDDDNAEVSDLLADESATTSDSDHSADGVRTE